MIINDSTLRALFVGFRTEYQNAFEGAPKDFEKIATTVPSATKENVYPWLGQNTALREWIGERVIQNLSVHKYAIENRKFESTIAISRDSVEDDTIGIYKPAVQELGRAAGTHPDQMVFGLLKAGFSVPCYDGQYFFDTDHPVAGVSVSNLIAGAATPWYLMVTKRALKPLIWQVRRPYEFVHKDKLDDDNVFMREEFLYGVSARVNAGFGLWQMAVACKDALTAANYAAARAKILSFTSDVGEPLGLIPDLLVVPPSLEGAARKLLINDRNDAGASNEWAGSAELLVTPWLATA
ncbi:MAG: Mu-like prophage major head subunit gpT family protein [Deltaproteobacteria bacterium]|jgi:phage major head subunit gpT-like protein|nr:Mu-like prophage major head subunit gpT family protein [Deltaproteobacteria bacterium]